MTSDQVDRHLQRARELGVTLAEYAEAYDVDLELLQTGRDALSDFVPVTVINNNVSTSGVVCRLVHADGWTLECQSWPPASWLRSLGGGVS